MSERFRGEFVRENVQTMSNIKMSCRNPVLFWIQTKYIQTPDKTFPKTFGWPDMF